jgi:hypothetical protein
MTEKWRAVKGRHCRCHILLIVFRRLSITISIIRHMWTRGYTIQKPMDHHNNAMWLHPVVAATTRSNPRKMTTQRRHQIYYKQFQVLCICSVIGLTLLSLRRLSLILQPPLFSLGEDDVLVDEEWRDFVDDYQSRFPHHRAASPPDGFDAWFQFAKENQCETRRFYESLDQDLAYFRNKNNKSASLLRWDRAIPEGLKLTDK